MLGNLIAFVKKTLTVLRYEKLKAKRSQKEIILIFVLFFCQMQRILKQDKRRFIKDAFCY